MQGPLPLYKPEYSADRAKWVIRNCYGPLWSLQRLVPIGLEMYVRICHPGWRWETVDRTKEEAIAVDDYEEMKRATPLRWCDIAKENGHKVHRSMQWGAIAPAPVDYRSGKRGVSPPHEGEINLEILDTVFEVLLRHSGKYQECICAFWGGFGIANVDGAQIKVIGQQNHILKSASLASVRDQSMVVLTHGRETAPLIPQVIWPTTEDWCFAIPFDLRSSFFGGPTSMALEINNSQHLETYEVFVGDKFLG